MFVQVIEFRTNRIDEIEKLSNEMRGQRDPNFTARRAVVCEDRDTPGRYFDIVFFDSYESAMKNSELPIVQDFATRMAGLTDGGPTFYNLDVIDDQDLTT